MECKGIFSIQSAGADSIRIVPEWNVKAHTGLSLVTVASISIRIVPEWNVKVYARIVTLKTAILESYQSGM